MHELLNAPLLLMRARLQVHKDRCECLDLNTIGRVIIRESDNTEAASMLQCMQRLMRKFARMGYIDIKLPAIQSLEPFSPSGMVGITIGASSEKGPKHARTSLPTVTRADLSKSCVRDRDSQPLSRFMQHLPNVQSITMPRFDWMTAVDPHDFVLMAPICAQMLSCTTAALRSLPCPTSVL